MAYPPVPYPSLQVIQEQGTGRPSFTATADDGDKGASDSSECASQAKGIPLFSSPFKTPSTVMTSQVPATPRRTKVQDLTSSSQTSPDSVEASPTTPSALPARRLARTAVPFKTPTKSTPVISERSTAAEIAQLERRIAHLRQARRYQLATERGDRDGDGELERLCDKWKDAGKLAADMLFERMPSPDSALSDSNDLFVSWGFADSTATSKRTSGGSSWGFASLPPSSDPLGPGSSSFFTKRGPTSEELVSDFMRKVDEEAHRRGVSRLKILEEFEDREHEEGGMDLEHPDIQFANLAQLSKKCVGVKRKGAMGASLSTTGSKRVKLEKLDEGSASAKTTVDNDDDSEDELLDALDELIASSSLAKEAEEEDAGDEEQGDQRDTVECEEPVFEDEPEDIIEMDVEQPEEKEWNVGKMMQRVGIDPTLFGWDETFEAFA